MERGAAIRGEQVFSETGCGSCHIPELPLESRFFRQDRITGGLQV